ncbi:MAG: hypothetical protein AB8G23_24940 [Myxococcota bacterium]
MSWQDLGSIGELIGAIATVVTLIYLAIQIRINTSQLKENEKASQRHSLDQTVEAFSRYRHLVAQPGIAEQLELGLESYDDLDAAARVRFRAVVEEYFFVYTALLNRSRHGAYSFDTSSSSIALPLGTILERAGGQQWWADRSSVFPHEFVQQVESQFPNAALTAPPKQAGVTESRQSAKGSLT